MRSLSRLMSTISMTMLVFGPLGVHSFATMPAFLRNLAGLKFASPEDVQTALKNPKTIVLDVRSPQEIAETGKFQNKQSKKWINVPCSPMDTRVLQEQAPTQMASKTAPVLIYCASGMRASKAKKALDELGYTDVINAGGWQDVQQYMTK